MQIFEIPEFKPFELIKQYEDLCFRVCPTKDCEQIFEGSYAIMPISWFVPSSQLIKLHIPHFASDQLVALKSIKQSNAATSFFFKKELLTLEWNVVKNFVDVIFKHLDQRMVQGLKLTQYHHIRQLIAEIVADLEMAKSILSVQADSSGFIQISDWIEGAALKLMKLPGGRAFLRGSVLELVWTLRAFKNVYYFS